MMNSRKVAGAEKDQRILYIEFESITDALSKRDIHFVIRDIMNAPMEYDVVSRESFKVKGMGRGRPAVIYPEVADTVYSPNKPVAIYRGSIRNPIRKYMDPTIERFTKPNNATVSHVHEIEACIKEWEKLESKKYTRNNKKK